MGSAPVVLEWFQVHAGKCPDYLQMVQFFCPAHCGTDSCTVCKSSAPGCRNRWMWASINPRIGHCVLVADLVRHFRRDLVHFSQVFRIIVLAPGGYVNWKEHKLVAQDLKAIYRAATVEQAEQELAEFAGRWNRKCPTIAAIWQRNWERVIPFFAFPAEIRKIIYTPMR